MKHTTRLAISTLAALVSAHGFAAVSADEARQLGTTLTPWGAEKAGNKEGTIPAYTGEPVKKPASYDPSKPGQKPDPFNEKPLFSITAKNYEKYADKLDGSVEMFKHFPNYRMDIYPTHRSWVYPKLVIDNTIKNATECKAVKEEQSLQGCYGGFPFPIPKTGNQEMWNHLLQYEAFATGGITENFITTSAGTPVLQVRTYINSLFPYYDPSRTGVVPSDITYSLIRTIDEGPPRNAGGSTVLQDPLDWTTGGRRAYQYIPGQRRVKLAPVLSYDTPSPYSGGGQTMDDQKAFMGALDRYDFKLIGKKEKYIPYDNFAMFDYKSCSSEKAFSTPNFANPDCVRFELHRVWVVEATLKPNYRHVYKKRIFFWDEDVPGAGIAENYDSSGKLYRLISSFSEPFYETPGGVGGLAGSAFMSTDLSTGVAGNGGTGTCADARCGQTATVPKPESFFSPLTMAGEGIR